MILTIPCLFLSAAAARRVHQLHRTIKSTGRFHSGSQLSNGRIVPSERTVSPPNNTTPTSDEPNVSPSATLGTLSTSHKQSETWEVLGSIEGPEDDELDPRRQMGDMLMSCKPNLFNGDGTRFRD